MSFSFHHMDIEGAYLIKPHIFIDNRGMYKKTFLKEEFLKYNLPVVYNETSDIISNKGSIRGLHYQEINSQAKLLHVIKGSIYDVFIDLRPSSKTFLKVVQIKLDAREDVVLFIPSGCAHGFMALEDDTIFSYQSNNSYHAESSGGILRNDPYLKIEWPLKNDLILTEKDKSWPTIKEYLKKKGIKWNEF